MGAAIEGEEAIATHQPQLVLEGRYCSSGFIDDDGNDSDDGDADCDDGTFFRTNKTIHDEKD